MQKAEGTAGANVASIETVHLVPFPIVDIVFGGQSHNERRPDSVPLYGILSRPWRDGTGSLSMTIRAESKCPMRKQHIKVLLPFVNLTGVGNAEHATI